MALQTSGIVLPRTVAAAVATKAKDSSTIATLSPSKPELFEDETYLVFNGASEADVVEEGAAKGSYEQPVTPVVAKRVTVQTTTRVSNQLKWADEDNQLEIVQHIQDDQGGAIGRALDYLVYHAVNPKTGAAVADLTALKAMTGVNHAYLGAALGSATAAQLIASIDSMAEKVNDLHDINGVAIAKTYANALRKIRVENTMVRMFPEIPLSLKVGGLEGIAAACSGTVNGRLVNTGTAQSPVYGTDVLGVMGDFSLIKWGMVRDMRAELIEFGDPDGAGDLKRYNQVAYRTEAVLAFAVLDASAFSILHSGTE